MFWIERFKQHVYVKRKTRICTTWPSFASTCPLLFIISSSRILSIRIFFFLLIFVFWEILNFNLTFAEYVREKCTLEKQSTFRNATTGLPTK